ncbi:MAG: type II secretion system protein GspH [Candidatus Parabeggiatoa sp. nov. 3]|nr:MAG: type II secretion system protein GspH [Gammaproteobacteria bacterium]RKZ57007.1 MAG: type II secretion system protein GspH [Gammaproteobacteria bacterium]RKZ78103.1 MAG: type II secretion system protein GspH [Gammaproteobacteria bacterium]
MPKLQTKTNGFTLIEIMVVMIIIGVILSFATLSIGDGGLAQKLEQEAQRLTALLKLAQTEAIMQAKEMGISFDNQGYRFYVLQAQKWQPFTIQDDIFRPRTLPKGIFTEIHLEGEPIILNEAKNTPQLLLLSSGELIPFQILFIAETDETMRYRITGTALWELSLQQVQRNE